MIETRIASVVSGIWLEEGSCTDHDCQSERKDETHAHADLHRAKRSSFAKLMRTSSIERGMGKRASLSKSFTRMMLKALY